MAERPPAAEVRNPYPGLRPFNIREEHLFFGRERQIDRLVDKLAANRFLAVVGTSGSGKSSLVNCGLRPALHSGNLASAGASWRMAQFRPGSDPIAALAAALASPGVLFNRAALAEMAAGSLPAPRLIDLTLRLGSLGLVDMVEQARLPEGTQLLVVADQFEELFRFRNTAPDGAAPQYGPGAEATAFVQLLLAAAAQTELPIYVVLTMRSDYLGDCAQFHNLPEAINEGQYLVPRLTRDEIRSAITGPALLAQAQISAVLLTRLLNDVGDNPDQLSILQHALNRTFAFWDNDCGANGPLDLAHYEAIGCMHSALDRHAEKAFGELADPGQPGQGIAGAASPALSAEQALAVRVLRTLTDKGTDARGIRRPTSMARLGQITGASPAALETVMARFRKASRSFLMPPEGEPLTPDTRVDISHESLMRVWRRLNQWADDEAAAARQLRRLADSAEMHQQLYGPGSTNPAGLLTDRELALARDWRQRHAPNEAWADQYGGRYGLVDSFIQRSQQVRLASRVEAEIELQWQTRGRLVLIGLTGATFMVLQVLLAGPVDGLLTRILGPFLQAHPELFRAMVQFLTHLLVGVPTLMAYDFLEPRVRRWKAGRDRPEVTARLDIEANAQPQPPAAPAAQREAVAPYRMVAAEGIASATVAATLSAFDSATLAATAAATAASSQGPGSAAMAAPMPAAQAATAAPSPAAALDANALARANDPTQRAGPMRRLGAAIVDFAVFAAMLLLFVGFSPIAPMEADGNRGAMTITEFMVTWLLAGVVSSWGLHSQRQATLGKRLMGLMVVDRHGQRLSFWRAYLRHAGKYLSWMLLGLGWAPLLFGNRKRRALPDVLAGTLVLLRPADRP